MLFVKTKLSTPPPFSKESAVGFLLLQLYNFYPVPFIHVFPQLSLVSKNIMTLRRKNKGILSFLLLTYNLRKKNESHTHKSHRLLLRKTPLHLHVYFRQVLPNTPLLRIIHLRGTIICALSIFFLADVFSEEGGIISFCLENMQERKCLKLDESGTWANFSIHILLLGIQSRSGNGGSI